MKCQWIMFPSHRICGKPATHIEPLTRGTYCDEHAQHVADMFGFDQIDKIGPRISDGDYAKLGPMRLDELGDDE